MKKKGVNYQKFKKDFKERNPDFFKTSVLIKREINEDFIKPQPLIEYERDENARILVEEKTQMSPKAGTNSKITQPKLSLND